MAHQQLTLGKFFSGVPQKKKSDDASKKVYELKRKRQFLESWKKDFEGIENSEDGMICKFCKEFPDIAGPSSFVSGNTTYRIHSIRSHLHTFILSKTQSIH